MAPEKLSSGKPSEPLNEPRTGRHAALMTRPQKPSRLTASKAGTRYCVKYFSSTMNCVAAAA